MTSPQRLPASLTPLDAALAALLGWIEQVAPVELPLADALHGIAAELPPLPACPPRDIAAADGYAFQTHDLVGASSYSPMPLSIAPVWVEAGDAMPANCDCVLDFDAVDLSGPMPQVLAEATPGQGVRRMGSDISAGGTLMAVGETSQWRVPPEWNVSVYAVPGCASSTFPAAK
jgi:molybdopterin molybdotransferase